MSVIFHSLRRGFPIWPEGEVKGLSAAADMLEGMRYAHIDLFQSTPRRQHVTSDKIFILIGLRALHRGNRKAVEDARKVIRLLEEESYANACPENRDQNTLR